MIKNLAIIFFVLPITLICQEEKEKFVKEKYLHFKIGSTINFYNAALYNSVIKEFNNALVIDPATEIQYNPLVEVGFESRFSKLFGINIGFGFTQTRHYYVNDYRYPPLIISNIPNFNIRPTFYYKNTGLQLGLGLYKYYYYGFSGEGLAIYSSIGIMQSVDIKTHRFTITASYFGPAKIYDSGFQLSFGIAL